MSDPDLSAVVIDTLKPLTLMVKEWIDLREAQRLALFREVFDSCNGPSPDVNQAQRVALAVAYLGGGRK